MTTNTTTIKFNKDSKELYHLQISSSSQIESFSISSDASNAVISTKKQLKLYYFKKLFSNHNKKKEFKGVPFDGYKNIGVIKMHPFFDEKDYLAGCYEKKIIIHKISKGRLIEDKVFSLQHNDNIISISWQNLLGGLLASFSTDKVINFYDVKYNKNPIFFIKEEEQIKSIEFCYSNPNLIAVGYTRKLKIFDLTDIICKYKQVEYNSLNSDMNTNKNINYGLAEYSISDDIDLNLKNKETSFQEGKFIKNSNENKESKENHYQDNRESITYQNELSNVLYNKEKEENLRQYMKNNDSSASKINTLSNKTLYSYTPKNVFKYIQPGKILKEVFNFSAVDLINWYDDDTYFVVGSKTESIVKIINYQEMKIEGEIFINSKSFPSSNNQSKLLKCYYMKGDLILSICENVILIHLFNRLTKRVSFYQAIDISEGISSFKLMTTNISIKYFIYIDKSNTLNMKKYIINAFNYYSTNIKFNEVEIEENIQKIRKFSSELKRIDNSLSKTMIGTQINKCLLNEKIRDSMKRIIFNEIELIKARFGENIEIEYKKSNSKFDIQKGVIIDDAENDKSSKVHSISSKNVSPVKSNMNINTNMIENLSLSNNNNHEEGKNNKSNNRIIEEVNNLDNYLSNGGKMIFELRISLDLMIIRLKITYKLNEEGFILYQELVNNLCEEEKSQLYKFLSKDNIRLKSKFEIFLDLNKEDKAIWSKLFILLPKIEIMDNVNQHIFIDNSLIRLIDKEIGLYKKQAEEIKIKEKKLISFLTNNSNEATEKTNEIFLETLLIKVFSIIEFTKKRKERESDINLFNIDKNKKNNKENIGICPYIKTIGFTWSPKGNLLYFRYSKIDIKNIKPQEKTINNTSNLNEWVSLCLTGVSSQYKNNLLSSNETIIPMKLRKLISIDSPLVLEESKVYEYLNNQVNTKQQANNKNINGNNNINGNFNWTRSKIKKPNENYFGLNPNELHGVLKELNELSHFSNEMKIKFGNVVDNKEVDNEERIIIDESDLETSKNLLNIQNTFINNSNYENIISFKKSENENESNIINNEINDKHKKKDSSLTSIYLIELDYFKERNFIVENLEVRIFSKEKFFNHINELLIKLNSSSSIDLLEILNLINFFINSIIEVYNFPIASSPLILKHYANNILKVLITLEQKKYFTYLYITVLLITSRLCDNLISTKRINSQLNEYENYNNSYNENKNTKKIIKTVSLEEKLHMNSNMFFKNKKNKIPKTYSNLSQAIIIHEDIKDISSCHKSYKSSSYQNQKHITQENVQNVSDTTKQSVINITIDDIYNSSTKKIIERGVDNPIVLSIEIPRKVSIENYFLMKNYLNSNQNSLESKGKRNREKDYKAKEINCNEFSKVIKKYQHIEDDSELGFASEYKMKAGDSLKARKVDNQYMKYQLSSKNKEKETNEVSNKDSKEVNEKNNFESNLTTKSIENSFNEKNQSKEKEKSNEQVNEKENNQSTVEFSLIHLFPKNVYVTFCDILYFYSTELYRLNRMVERAQIDKFIRILTEGLNINKYILHSNIVNVSSHINLTHNIQKSKRPIIKNGSNNLDNDMKLSFKSKFPMLLQLFPLVSNIDIFKRGGNNKLLLLTCDICGQILKKGEFTISSYKYKVQGHFNHVIDYINNLLRKNISNYKQISSASFKLRNIK